MAVAAAVAPSATAGPVYQPSPADGDPPAVETLGVAPPTIDPTSRSSVRNTYDNWYAPAKERLNAWQWGGSVETCVAGTTPQWVKEDSVRTVNFYRELTGTRPLTIASQHSTALQEAALIMTAAGELSHFPPSDWPCWTTDGYEGAGMSNLSMFSGGLGWENFMEDYGEYNIWVGHRQGLLNPWGEALNLGMTSGATTASVFGGDDPADPTFTGWPVAGYNPVELWTWRWHYNYTDVELANCEEGEDPQACYTRRWDTSNAEIEVTLQGGEPFEYDIHVIDGEPTFTLDLIGYQLWEAIYNTDDDVTVQVEASGFVADGEPVPDLTYAVTYAKPARWVAGPEDPEDPTEPDDGSVEGRFDDTTGHIFEGDIAWLAEEGITKGCNPPDNTQFCPDDHVTRGQMAAFLVRALRPVTSDATFADTAGHVFEADIAALAGAGITQGCNPPENSTFCPDELVTRGQMAAFLVRALGYSDDGGSDLYIDDNGNVFEGDIDRLGTAGVTRGCNPPVNDRFCPDDPVTRGQMAAFLKRALGD